MTQEELYEVVRNWNDEKSGERAAVLVSVEKDGDEANSCSAVMGVPYPLIEGVTKAIEQNKEVMLLIAAALGELNNSTFDRILNAVTQARMMYCKTFDNKEK